MRHSTCGVQRAACASAAGHPTSTHACTSPLAVRAKPTSDMRGCTATRALALYACTRVPTRAATDEPTRLRDTTRVLTTSAAVAAFGPVLCRQPEAARYLTDAESALARQPLLRRALGDPTLRAVLWTRALDCAALSENGGLRLSVGQSLCIAACDVRLSALIHSVVLSHACAQAAPARPRAALADAQHDPLQCAARARPPAAATATAAAGGAERAGRHCGAVAGGVWRAGIAVGAGGTVGGRASGRRSRRSRWRRGRRARARDGAVRQHAHGTEHGRRY